MGSEGRPGAQRGRPLNANAKKGLEAWRRNEAEQVAWKHSISLASLRRLAADTTGPQWLRWLAGRMYASNMDRDQLAKRLALTRKTVYSLMERSNTAPAVATVRRLEEVFGPMPAGVRRAIREERSGKSGGKRSQQRLRKRAGNWTRERLEDEIGRLGLLRLPQTLATALRRLPYGRPLGQEAYRLYSWARAAQMR